MDTRRTPLWPCGPAAWIVFLAVVLACALAPGAVPARAQAPAAESPSGTGPAAAATRSMRARDWGPILFPTPLSPFQKLRFVFFHQSPMLPPVDTWTFASTATWANLWVNNDRLIMDVEAWSLNEFAEYTMADRVAVSLLVPFIYINGGFMDGIIEKFHDLLHLDNMRRDRGPRHNVRLEVKTANGPVRIVESEGRTLWARAPVLSLRVRLTPRDAETALAIKASVDIPELERSSNLVDDSGRDWGLGVALDGPLGGRWAAFGSLAYLQLRPGRLPEYRLAQEQFSLTLALTYALQPDVAFLVQMAHDSAVARETGTGFDRAATNFSFGWKWLLESGTVLEFAIVENLFVADNNADFALHGGAMVTY